MLGVSFLSWFCSFRDPFFNLIRFEDTNDSIVISKGDTDTPWHDMAMEISSLGCYY